MNSFAEIVAGGIVLALIIGFATLMDGISCGSKAKMMSMNHDYSFFNGCMVEVQKNKWRPIETLRETE